ncbi:FHA domain-containing protein [Clostridium estertheticum]|uniref:FHA domain-containing protein n=1 Tax=Clostridium estertheticum TaxID=238834 RepID=UPI001C0C5F4B|nr:FHA domain-containing protein [Clostridium estertheticum]MBU3215896.1 FHA domain-containing protein [Clostridium estertheticum]WAG54116.1 FHA domain-containing protein [Clostridium estertheticum]
MNNLVVNDLIKENRDNSNISYILEQEYLFFETGYKVLQNQEKNGFIKCVKVSHNGKTKLVYDISKYKSLKSLLHQLTPENFLSIVSRVLNIVSEVKHNGFMQCENIEVNLDKIFIDSNNLNAFFIYLPVNTHTSLSSIGIFERELKKNLAEAISENNNLNKEMVYGLYNDLQNENYRLDEIKENMKRNIIIRDPMKNEFGIQSGEAPSEGSNKLPINPLQTGQESGSLAPGDDHFEGREIENLKIIDKAEPRLKLMHKLKPKTKTKNIKTKANDKKIRLIKPPILIIIQICTVLICVGIILSFNYKSKTSMISIGVTLAIDLITSILIYIFVLKKKKKVQAPSNMDFKPIYEGGATEVLDSIFTPSISLTGIGTKENIKLVISKPEFIIGKNPEAVDGVIQFNKTISRVHCKVSYINNSYVIEDLESSNGTYVNLVKLQKGQRVQIQIGDKVRLSNSDFMVKTAK